MDVSSMVEPARSTKLPSLTAIIVFAGGTTFSYLRCSRCAKTLGKGCGSPRLRHDGIAPAGCQALYGHRKAWGCGYLEAA